LNEWNQLPVGQHTPNQAYNLCIPVCDFRVSLSKFLTQTHTSLQHNLTEQTVKLAMFSSLDGQWKKANYIQLMKMACTVNFFEQYFKLIKLIENALVSNLWKVAGNVHIKAVRCMFLAARPNEFRDARQ
jgi:ribosome-associated toxin RatA of RatAB toxin-antitoxin module